jgi:hypothetical protein
MRRTGQEEMDIGNHFFFEPANTLNAGLFLLSPALASETSLVAAMQTSASSLSWRHMASYL